MGGRLLEDEDTPELLLDDVTEELDGADELSAPLTVDELDEDSSTPLDEDTVVPLEESGGTLEDDTPVLDGA